MVISVTAILTLIAIVVPGPIIFCVLPRFRGRPVDEEPDDELPDVPMGAVGTYRETVNFAAYLLQLLGYAIGIGNLWRFPFLVGQNGGAAFVFAYLIAVVTLAIPLFLMELGIGQQLRKSTINAFRAIHPRWAGLGYAQILLIFFVQSYFNILIAWALYYLVASVNTPFPWAESTTSADYWFETTLNKWSKNETINVDLLADNGLGPVQWHLALSLFFVYIMNFLALAFGKEILEKVTWVTVLGPVFLLIVLLLRCIILPGAYDGISFYILRIEGSALFNVQTWQRAFSQILFSLGPAFGTAITSSSYSQPDTDVFKTCLIVTCSNSLFSIVGGFAIFSILGNVAFLDPGSTVKELAQASGPGLAFITVADAMKNFGALSNVMAVLFFSTLLALGLDSSFAQIETVISVAEDGVKGTSMKGKLSKTVLTFIICVALYLVGLSYCTRGGSDLLSVIDNYAGSLFLLLSASIEAFVVLFGYGSERLQAGIKRATRGTPGYPLGRDLPAAAFFNCAYKTSVPIAPTVLVVYGIIDTFFITGNGPDTGRGIYYPVWLNTIGAISLLMHVLATASTLALKGSSSLPPFELKDSLAKESEMTS